ncbi:hypothetical protein RM844_30530 [Streptomyces sp. DSM 44915]|uniref:Uncharacterized protein n=1 Tax=Streptomyces chisholmiae TaxID=3075540 RepID=A0ABU2K039_9ACTN|nr:hypothetical protein [Streptomyces sp. DSM 44915]MDT0270618.1 hypothetical protein [Streptomyces sp. DSM 44915]
MSAYVPLIAVAAGLIAVGVGLVVLAHLPGLTRSTGPVPEPTPGEAELDAWRAALAAELAADLDGALRRHGLADTP